MEATYTRRILIMAVAAAIALLGSCATATDHQRALRDTLVDFGRGLRWSELDVVASHLPPSQRASFAVRRERASDVKVINVDIRRVHVSGDAMAQVTLRVEWYHVAQGRLVRTLIQQLWRRKDDAWAIEQTRTVAGPRFPLLLDTPADLKSDLTDPHEIS